MWFVICNNKAFLQEYGMFQCSMPHPTWWNNPVPFINIYKYKISTVFLAEGAQFTLSSFVNFFWCFTICQFLKKSKIQQLLKILTKNLQFVFDNFVISFFYFFNETISFTILTILDNFNKLHNIDFFFYNFYDSWHLIIVWQ